MATPRKNIFNSFSLQKMEGKCENFAAKKKNKTNDRYKILELRVRT